jgi:hypothetical protein
MTINEKHSVNWTPLTERLQAIFREPVNIEMLVDALERVINNTRYGAVSIIIIDGRVSLITEENKQKVI